MLRSSIQFDILTIFPKIFDSFLNESILKKARRKKIIKINIHDFRQFVKDRHKSVDDKPYGGGPGMILRVEPIYRCLKALKRRRNSKVILLTPKGKLLDQNLAGGLSKLAQIILICGRYEGFDDRLKKFVDMEVSIGPYVLMGGEIPAMALIESVSRLFPGVVGKKDSLKEETFSKALNYIEYPQYTRPPVFKEAKVPAILLSGDHQKIKKWRQKHSKIKK